MVGVKTYLYLPYGINRMVNGGVGIETKPSGTSDLYKAVWLTDLRAEFMGAARGSD